MTYSTVLPIWNAARQRFLKTAQALTAEDLSLRLGQSSIGYLLHHTAEAEYMFAEWFFGKMLPTEGIAKPSLTSIEQLIDLLIASNDHLLSAMEELTEEQWHTSVESRMGQSTPLEAIGRLMYHTGIHAGQISLIQKNGQSQTEQG
ncbi:DinB family protein [Sporosarcina sp. YIM B06819]|uniref:DinB family protein n=1 Tax=Sporosarcina sp. YIM B06819 TaxID=3081769 RepID=UPI00298BF47A|nr:DinB family protein [Sporosarcina sp. YIM B06819]